ncbi:MAG: glutaredoxin domain-containing protein [Candidatus Thermoplasmatota archaeon]|nr:glutaredoxin domain-containing protein [Candidatus Thermoplasmatota archaeon]
MEFILYQQPGCPFCKHFKRLFYKHIPEGKEIEIPDHGSKLWMEHGLEFVPTVVAYQNGKEVERLPSMKLIGIRKSKWIQWLNVIKGKYGIDRTESI